MLDSKIINTMAQAKQIYKRTSGHFFDKDTMEFWGSKIESELYSNRCFITSEDDFYKTKRLYTIRQFNESFTTINTIGEFQQYTKLNEAKESVKEI